MLTHLIALVEGLFQSYGALGVFVASIIEEVVAPIPSALVMMGAGFSLIGEAAISMSSLSRLLVLVALPAALGVTVGSLLVYGISYWIGKPFLDKWGKYIGVPKGSIERAQEKFDKGYADELVVFGLRVIPLIPSVVISAFCGLVRIPFRSYVLYTFLGTFLRALILGFVGWQAQSLYVVWAEKIEHFEKYIEIGIVVLVLAYGGYGFSKYIRQRQKRLPLA